MTAQYLKQATRTPSTDEGDTRARVESMLAEIEQGGEIAGTVEVLPEPEEDADKDDAGAA